MPWQVENTVANFNIPFHKVSVYHCIKFIHQDPFSTNPTADVVIDSIHCKPACLDQYGNQIPGQFDTVIIRVENGGWAGLKGMRKIHTFTSYLLTLLHRLLHWSNMMHICATACSTKFMFFRTKFTLAPCLHRLVYTIQFSLSWKKSWVIQDLSMDHQKSTTIECHPCQSHLAECPPNT